MRADPLATMMHQAAELEGSAAADRRERQSRQLSAIASKKEPVSLGSILAGPNPFTFSNGQVINIPSALETLQSRYGEFDRVSRLRHLEHELCALLATSPPLWAELRRPLTRLLRRARQQLRALERHGAP